MGGKAAYVLRHTIPPKGIHPGPGVSFVVSTDLGSVKFGSPKLPLHFSDLSRVGARYDYTA